MNLPLSGFYRSSGPSSENQRKRKERRVPRPRQRPKKSRDGDTNFSWSTWDGLQRLRKGTERVENRETNRDHPDYSIVEITQNTEKSPGDLWILAVTQTLTKDHQLTTVIHWELCKKFKFDHTIKWYMHNTESVIENKTHSILGDFEIQMGYQVTARQPGLVMINNNKKENLPVSRLCGSDWPQTKTEKMRKER